MSDELRDKLSRLGVHKGSRRLRKAPPIRTVQPTDTTPTVTPSGPNQVKTALEQVAPGGRLLLNEAGGCYVVEQVYPLNQPHGQREPAELLSFEPAALARLCGDDRVATFDIDRLLFLDTETTGLAGAGTIAFMVGTAFFEQNALLVRQYFLRDHADEQAMLLELAGLIKQKPAVVSFNGRSFDIPLLENRFFLNRIEPFGEELRQQPHLDLLPPARRLWRWQWRSCSLSSLEENVLGVRRTEEDVPGSLIPWLYMDYLRSGDPGPLSRVFYHNQIDMLSMVALAAELLTLTARPDRPLFPLERLGLARWHLGRGDDEMAEALLLAGVNEIGGGEARRRLLEALGELLKKRGRRAEAVRLWEELAIDHDDLPAHIELAKYFEWHDADLVQAVFWTERALFLADSLPAWRGYTAEIRHRLTRLTGKIGPDI